MRKFELDNKAVRAPHATRLGFSKGTVKRGDVFTFTHNQNGDTAIARSLGRIKSCDSDGADCRGHVCALVLGMNANHAFVRWIDPNSITEVTDVPAKLAAFFFAPTLPYSSDMLLQLAAHGTLSEQFIGNAGGHVAAWRGMKRGMSPQQQAAQLRSWGVSRR